MKHTPINNTLRVVVVKQDVDAQSPADWCNLGKITYRRSARYVLGTEAINNERYEEIERGLAKGDLIGMPVFAYVHSGSTIQAAYSNPFHCQWDSGRSGWVYASREDVLRWFGRRRMDAALKARALAVLVDEVKTYDQFLRGEVYCYHVERLEGGEWTSVASCGDYYSEAEAETAGVEEAKDLVALIEREVAA